MYVLQILIVTQSEGVKGDELFILPVNPTAFIAGCLTPYDENSTSGSVQVTRNGNTIIAGSAYKRATYHGLAFFI